jgi:transcription-repair coupling factor (superfamily II helicase)
MFIRLMETAITELKGESVYESLEPEINVTMSALIPESYISNIDQRLLVYRRLAKMTELGEVNDFKAELIDRFGELPSEAANLLVKIMLKVLARVAGVKRIDLKGQELFIYFSESHLKSPAGIVDMIVSRQTHFKFTSDQVLIARLVSKGLNGRLGEAKNILKEIAQHANF